MLVFKCMRVCVYVSVLAPMCACVCLFGKCFFSGGRGVEKYTSLSYIEHIPWIFLDVICISLIGERFPKSHTLFPCNLFHCIVVAADFVCLALFLNEQGSCTVAQNLRMKMDAWDCVINLPGQIFHMMCI